MNVMNFVRKFGDPMKRSTWQALVFVLMLPVVLLGILWITLTSKPTPALAPDEAILEAILLKVDDLPWGPEAVDIKRPLVSNGIGKVIWYRLFRDRPWINISEGVYVYQTETAAMQGYETLLSEYASFKLQGWEAMPQITFLHHADEMHPSCAEGYFDGQHHFACEIVGRYGRVVIAVGGNIYDKRWLTAEQFREVLTRADQKAHQSRKDQ